MIDASVDVRSILGNEALHRWNIRTDLGTPVVVTYSFPTQRPDYDTGYEDRDFGALSAAHQNHVRTALDIWGAAGGISFVEVPDNQDGDIRFSFLDMAGMTLPNGQQVAGYAYYPTRSYYTIDGEQVNFVAHNQLGGDVFLNMGMYGGSASTLAPGQDGFYVLLHELGHALGLQHPFDGEPVISSSHDHANYTVMSYNRNPGTDELGSVDLEAMALAYGAPGADLQAYWDAAQMQLVIAGGSGSDQIIGNHIDSRLMGRAGDDVFFLSQEGTHEVLGGAGVDTLSFLGYSSQFTLGGDEDDPILWNGNLYVMASDVERVQFLDEELSLATLFGPGVSWDGTDMAEHQAGGTGADTLNGQGGDDTLLGGVGADDLNGGLGQDSLDGGGGDDTVMAGAGEDELFGDQGNDLLNGEEDNDTLHGGEGTDTLIGGDGDDALFGGDGPDDLRDDIYGGQGNDSLDGGYGNDQLRGDAGHDTLTGGFGADTVIGGDGDDVLTAQAWGDLLFGGAGDDFINGGFGYDRVNGGDGADAFFHLGVAGHGSDWIQDYDAAEGDVLQFGGAGATRSQFQVNFIETGNAGEAGVEEAFVIYRPTGQILWALVDGGGQGEINLQLGSEVHDLLI